MSKPIKFKKNVWQLNVIKNKIMARLKADLGLILSRNLTELNKRQEIFRGIPWPRRFFIRPCIVNLMD